MKSGIRLFAVLSVTLAFCGLTAVAAGSQSNQPSTTTSSSVVQEVFEGNIEVIDQTCLRVAVRPSLYSTLKLGPEERLLDVPVTARRTVRLDLEKFTVVSPDARFLIGSPSGDQPLGPVEVQTFRGEIENLSGSFAYLSISSDGMINGWLNDGTGEQYVMSTRSDEISDGNEYLTVRQSGIGAVPDVPFCGTEPETEMMESMKREAMVYPFSSTGPKLSRVGVEGDQAFVNLFPNVTAARDYVVQLLGAISAIYVRDLNIRLTLAFARMWPSGGEPFGPYDLGQFRDYWQTHYDTTGLNIIHLLSGKRDLPSYAGIAYINNTCSGNGAFGIDGYINGSFAAPVRYPDNGNWDINVFAHEMGHNHGTGHTHDDSRYVPFIDNCGTGTAARGTIMSYCHTFAGYQRNIDLHFHRRVEQLVTSLIAAADCHPYDCNGNNRNDSIDIALGFSLDVNGDKIPDECQDCNGNAILDPIDIINGAPDIDGNGILDACESDCNGNGKPDRFETWNGVTDDDGNNRPDVCDPDCNGNAVLDFNEINANMALDIDRNGRLDNCQDCNSNAVIDFVDLAYENDVMVCDPTSIVLRDFNALSGVIARSIAAFAGGPTDVTTATDGNIYSACPSANNIVRTNPATGANAVVLGGLTSPNAICTGPASTDLYFSEQTANRIRKVTNAGGAIWSTNLIAPHTSPTGMVIGPSGDLFVTSGGNNAVYRYNATTGALIGIFVTAGSGGLNGPRGMMFLPNGNLLVCSFSSNQILEYNGATGAFVQKWNDVYAITGPYGVKRGPNGNVFVTCQVGSQYRVLEYLTNGRNYRPFVRGSGVLASIGGLTFLPKSAGDLNQDYIPDICQGGDLDADGVADVVDNCPTTFNPAQIDSDGDGTGDDCDNCKFVSNSDQRDVDGDGIGDICDNCPAVSNISQVDADADARGDACDNCLGITNPGQEDADGDFIGDGCDLCPNDMNNDADGDGICGNVDNCPSIFNPGQEDADHDGFGDLCQPETFDTVATTCTKLAVSSHATFGNNGNGGGGGTMDYLAGGDCANTYLYDGSVMIIDAFAPTKTITHGLHGQDQFLPFIGGAPKVSTIDSTLFEVYRSGAMKTSDSKIAVEKIWYAPKNADTCATIIQCLKLYSADGLSHPNLLISEVVDWDIPAASGSNNTGGFDAANRLIYQRGTGTGCIDNTRRYGGLALIGSSNHGNCVDTSANIFSAVTQANASYLFGPTGPEADPMFTLSGTPGYSALGTSTDQFSLITYTHDTTIGPGDTMYFYTAVTSVRNGATTAVITDNVKKAKRWLVNHLRPVCSGSCCVGLSGNVDCDPTDNVDISDLSAIIDYLYISFNPLCCPAEANCDGDIGGGVDISDISAMIDFLYISFTPLAPCL